ncbi:MAG TPA: hypothetical protein DCZ75_15125 [Geobacter sp.]|nr:hypothetical protein [Geobacter sp.]
MKSGTGEKVKEGSREAKGNPGFRGDAKLQAGGFPATAPDTRRERAVTSPCARICSWSPDFGSMLHRGRVQTDGPFGRKESDAWISSMGSTRCDY